jgi:ketosteroid isomerase-like protein
MLSDMKDPEHNKFKSERLSGLKVRVSGDVAVATYKTTYDAMIHGQHYARTVITTDVFQRQDGAWKEISDHSSVAAKP